MKEIKQVARKDPVVAAEGAVILLEKLSPALEQVDSSSGAIGSAVNKAIESLIPIIVKAGVEPHVRQRWLECLWQALQDDDTAYIELLGNYWGELCAMPEIASYWADEFLPTVESVWNRTEPGFSYFKGISACLASLYAAGRYDGISRIDQTVSVQLVGLSAMGCTGACRTGQACRSDSVRRRLARSKRTGRADFQSLRGHSVVDRAA